MFVVGDRVVVNSHFYSFNGEEGEIIRGQKDGSRYYRVLLDNYTKFSGSRYLGENGLPLKSYELVKAKRTPDWEI